MRAYEHIEYLRLAFKTEISMFSYHLETLH